jgi:transposase
LTPSHEHEEVLSVEDWAEIRRLYWAERLSIKAIARRLGVSRNTVRKAVALSMPPKYVRKPSGSIVDAVEPRIRLLLQEFPDMPSTVIMERIGWTRGKTVLFERIASLRPLYRPVDPVSRTQYEAGELAQCDLWFPPADVPLGFGQVGHPPVLVMVAGYSRIINAVMIPTRQSPDLLAGQWQLLHAWGRVPRILVWDNESAVGQWRAGRPQLTEAMNAFRGSLGIRVIQCRPRDPEAKGLVERVNGYLETSFLPGRRFASPADFDWASTILCTTLHIVRKPQGQQGFAVIAHRWAVERTLAWLTAHRRLARDYEREPATSEAMTGGAAINTMTNRITRGKLATRQQRGNGSTSHAALLKYFLSVAQRRGESTQRRIGHCIASRHVRSVGGRPCWRCASCRRHGPAGRCR